MYLLGAEHPNKVRVSELLTQFVHENERLVTDVEVYQEVRHRYVSIRRHDAINPAIASLDAIADEVFPVHMADVRVAREMIASVSGHLRPGRSPCRRDAQRGRRSDFQP